MAADRACQPPARQPSFSSKEPSGQHWLARPVCEQTLRDSGSIEQDADVVMLLYRQEYYLRQEAPTDRDEEEQWMQSLEAVQGIAEVITAKFRQGRIGTDRLLFEGAWQRFTDLDPRGWR
jgi:replicative DNA helicase